MMVMTTMMASTKSNNQDDDRDQRESDYVPRDGKMSDDASKEFHPLSKYIDCSLLDDWMTKSLHLNCSFMWMV